MMAAPRLKCQWSMPQVVWTGNDRDELWQKLWQGSLEIHLSPSTSVNTGQEDRAGMRIA